MKQFRWLPIAVIMALALPQVTMGQDVLVDSDATYDYLLTINSDGMAVDPTADQSFAFVDPNNPVSNIAIWPFPEYPLAPVNGTVRDTGDPSTLVWRQAPGPFQYGGVGGITTGTDLLVDSGLGFTEDQLDGQKITQYFRTNFTTTSSLNSILIDTLVDDAAVFYIDGFEVARYNCCWTPDGAGEEPSVAEGGGAPFFDSRADDNNDVGDENIRNNAWTAPFAAGTANQADLSGFGGSLPAGDHVFGISVHSYGNFDSSDMGIDARLFTVNEDYEWSGVGSGSWTALGNWTSGVLTPNGIDSVANLLQLATASTTVYHNGGITLGTLNIDNSNKFAIAGLGTFTFESTAGNALIDVKAGNHEFQAPVALNSSTDVNVAAGASLEFNNDLRLNGNNLVLGGAGTVSVNNAVFANGGAVNAAAGAMVGGGTIHGDLINSGARLSPGNSAGVLTVNGDFTQTSDGTIEIELADSSNYDELVVSGNLEFGGTLVVSLLDGFEPAIGDEFGLFTFASSASSFNELLLPQLGNGKAWDVSGLYQAGNLAVVPEPTGLLMLVFGGLALVGLSRRHRS